MYCFGPITKLTSSLVSSVRGTWLEAEKRSLVVKKLPLSLVNRLPIGSSGHEYRLRSVIEFNYRASITSFTVFPLGRIMIGLINSEPISLSLPISRIYLFCAVVPKGFLVFHDNVMVLWTVSVLLELNLLEV